jgi:hypothetical protein
MYAIADGCGLECCCVLLSYHRPVFAHILEANIGALPWTNDVTHPIMANCCVSSVREMNEIAKEPEKQPGATV